MAKPFKNVSLLFLAATAIVTSRTLLLSFNDPEGTNLLVSAVAALIVYGVSLAVFFYLPVGKDHVRVLFALLAQVVLVVILFYFLR